MKITIILASLFSLSVSLAIPSIDLGQKVLFDSSYKEFKIAYKGPNNNFFLFLISHERVNLGIEVICPMEECTISKAEYKEYGLLFYYSNGGECTFKLDIDEEDKGSFIIYDFKALYEIKLKNIYGNIKMHVNDYYYMHEREIDESALKLTFLVPNFSKNSTITFEYQESLAYKNPFKVCHENVCQEDVTSYYFEKGKSYQIYVQIQKEIRGMSQDIIYSLPPFRFYAEDSSEEYSNDDIKYTYDTKPGPSSSSNYGQTSILFLLSLISLLF